MFHGTKFYSEEIKSQLPFYKKLESYLMDFCKLYKCNRILFMLPDYNLLGNIY